jgi:hypothetical protein
VILAGLWGELGYMYFRISLWVLASLRPRTPNCHPLRDHSDLLHKAFKIEEDALHSGAGAEEVVIKTMCRWVTSVPVDGYPGGRVTTNARPRTDVRKGDQGAKDAKALMQAILESSLVLPRYSVFPARITLKETIPHPKPHIALPHLNQASAASKSQGSLQSLGPYWNQ